MPAVHAHSSSVWLRDAPPSTRRAGLWKTRKPSTDPWKPSNRRFARDHRPRQEQGILARITIVAPAHAGRHEPRGTLEADGRRVGRPNLQIGRPRPSRPRHRQGGVQQAASESLAPPFRCNHDFVNLDLVERDLRAAESRRQALAAIAKRPGDNHVTPSLRTKGPRDLMRRPGMIRPARHQGHNVVGIPQ